MKVDTGIPATGGSFIAGTSATGGIAAKPNWPRELLPFTVRVASSEEEIEKAVSIRHSAYARHVPAFAEGLRAAEECDYQAGSVVLLAESKLDGSPLGTMRVQINRFRKLSLEQSVELPDWLKDKNLAEATRLGISLGRQGRVVKVMIFKAFLLYCLDNDIDWMVITARSPLDSQYDALLFQDVFPDRGFIPMQHVGNIPHRVMALAPRMVESMWREARHGLYECFFRTRHPDIDVRGRGNALADESWFARSGARAEVRV